MHQPLWMLTCRLVSVLHRKLYVQDICFRFLRRCLPAVYQQLCTAREHASVRLSGLYNCSWINEAAIVHLLVLLFCLFVCSCWRFITTRILKHHGGCDQLIFHTAYLWPEMSCAQNTVWNMCCGARSWAKDRDFLWIFMNRRSLNFNKHLKICKTHSHSVTKTTSRKLTHI